jgi:hypothetical protein
LACCNAAHVVAAVCTHHPPTYSAPLTLTPARFGCSCSAALLSIAPVVRQLLPAKSTNEFVCTGTTAFPWPRFRSPISSNRRSNRRYSTHRINNNAHMLLASLKTVRCFHSGSDVDRRWPTLSRSHKSQLYDGGGDSGTNTGLNPAPTPRPRQPSNDARRYLRL